MMIRPLSQTVPATLSQLQWAKDHFESFNRLVLCPEFSAAMRCYGNAHSLFDLDLRIMLLCSGIEGILSVDAELSRRIALCAALLFTRTPDERAAHFNDVKKSYAIRSRAVHGGKADAAKLKQGYESAGRILSLILARCVELGRVPDPGELDRLAMSHSLQSS